MFYCFRRLRAFVIFEVLFSEQFLSSLKFRRLFLDEETASADCSSDGHSPGFKESSSETVHCEAGTQTDDDIGSVTNVSGSGHVEFAERQEGVFVFYFE